MRATTSPRLCIGRATFQGRKKLQHRETRSRQEPVDGAPRTRRQTQNTLNSQNETLSAGSAVSALIVVSREKASMQRTRRKHERVDASDAESILDLFYRCLPVCV